MIGQRNSILSLRMLTSASRQTARAGRFKTASVLVLPGDFLGLGDGPVSAAESGSEKATILRALHAEGKVPRRADGKPLSAAELRALDVKTLQILRANIRPVKTGEKLKGLALAIAEHEAGR